MNCFQHEAVVAVASCSVCGRGICRDCVIDVGGLAVCRSRCEVAGAKFVVERDWQRQQASRTENLNRAARRGELGTWITLTIVLVGASYLFYTMRKMGAAAICLGFALICGWASFNATRAAKTPSLRACASCGYNLTGSTTAVCPECGTDIVGL